MKNAVAIKNGETVGNVEAKEIYTMIVAKIVAAAASLRITSLVIIAEARVDIIFARFALRKIN